MSRAGYECPGLLSVTLMSTLQLEHSKLREFSKNEEEENISSSQFCGLAATKNKSNSYGVKLWIWDAR